MVQEHQGGNKTGINSVLFSCRLIVLTFDPRHMNHAAKAEKKSNSYWKQREKRWEKETFRGSFLNCFFVETGPKKKMK